MEFLTAFCSFLLLGLAVSEGKAECPSLSVSPCTCTGGPLPTLECDKVYDTYTLKRVFMNSAGTRYSVVRLTNSVLQYIPSDIFEEVEVEQLHLINGTFVAIFNQAPKKVPSLRKLNIENTLFQRPINWELIQPFENLTILKIDSSTVKVLGDKFAQYAPKSLRQIFLNNTRTIRIEAGVFNHFSKLLKIDINHVQIKELNRNIFPVPFNGRYVHFIGNHLTSLPADMFSNMPQLRSVSLSGNNLSTLPRYPFEHLSYLDLQGNPLTCDCDLAWIVKNRSMLLRGTCSSPESLKGRKLKEVYKNMSC